MLRLKTVDLDPPPESKMAAGDLNNSVRIRTTQQLPEGDVNPGDELEGMEVRTSRT